MPVPICLGLREIKRLRAVSYRRNARPYTFVGAYAPSLAVADFMRDLKTSSSIFMRDEHDKFPLFCGWGKSYCALTCSASAKDGVVEYIKMQKEHHKKVGFREELLSLLEESGVDVDMRYFL